ncbi:MAG TPA: asparagine synthase (glutamine-hydrolyzing) [Streptosporangiaceae bacterium]|nr:asparagine synthase (glutamine-hydrolyzing) [Streptosporangiaceae bacterium]
MCGIAGWVDFSRDLLAERAAVEAMTATMACRGPDAGGVWCSGNALIGHRRLAVVDLPGGAQPMSDANAVLTFSGEIYNFRELRRELEGFGHDFRTRSDTEVLLRAWIQWGADCLRRLNGMFAFAIWDAASEELFLARDRLGVKPLCFARTPDGVLFGSEPKAILAHPGFRAELDAEGIAEILAPVGTRTPGHGVYRELSEVRPGYLVRVNRAGLTSRAYWKLAALPHSDDEADTIARVRELLDDIVDRQLIADVPLCTLLSGGLDSSAVTALAARSLERDGRGKLATYSVDFPSSQDGFQPDMFRPSHDEPFARLVAEHAGTRHTTIMLDAAELTAAAHMPRRAHDLPAFGDMFTSMYLLFRDLREHSTVALSGESADEVFGGYQWYHNAAMLAAPGFPWAMGSWAPMLRPEVDAVVRLDERAAQRYADAQAEVPRLAGEDAAAQRIREVLYHGLTRWLPMLLDRKDRLSMAVGLEVRVPFCDHRLVEYVFNVPWSLKNVGGIEKGLLRRATADVLPPEVTNRRKSIYPASADPEYGRAVKAEMSSLLGQPGAPLFEIIDRGRLAEAFSADPTLPGLMGIQPSPWAPVAFMIDVNAWLADYKVALV